MLSCRDSSRSQSSRRVDRWFQSSFLSRWTSNVIVKNIRLGANSRAKIWLWDWYFERRCLQKRRSDFKSSRWYSRKLDCFASLECWDLNQCSSLKKERAANRWFQSRFNFLWSTALLLSIVFFDSSIVVILIDWFVFSTCIFFLSCSLFLISSILIVYVWNSSQNIRLKSFWRNAILIRVNHRQRNVDSFALFAFSRWREQHLIDHHDLRIATSANAWILI